MSSYVTRYIHPDRSCPHSECHGREDVSDSGISTSTSFDHDRKILRTCLYRVLTGMSAYDLLESSVGIAVLEVNVTLDVAFLAAIETNTSYCPLWDSKKNLFVGALSSSDYLKIVLHAYDAYIRGDVTILDRLRFMSIEEFSRQKWAGTTYTTVPCITANIDEDNAVTIFQKLFMHRIHHIPLIASASTQPTICGVLTYQPLMITIADILVNLNQKVNVLELSMENLKIGTYGNHETLHVITMESKLELAFRIFLEHGVHILPVVNTEGVVLAVLSRSDLLSLEPATGCIDLSMCVQDILPERTKGEVNDIFVYHNHDTLRSVITHILWCGIRSLVAVDMQNRLTGMCSVGDLARFVYEVLFGDEPA